MIYRPFTAYRNSWSKCNATLDGMYAVHLEDIVRLRYVCTTDNVGRLRKRMIRVWRLRYADLSTNILVSSKSDAYLFCMSIQACLIETSCGGIVNISTDRFGLKNSGYAGGQNFAKKFSLHCWHLCDKRSVDNMCQRQRPTVFIGSNVANSSFFLLRVKAERDPCAYCYGFL
jgi:hypothetical protein